jgi:anaerobic magnesium-protoporphyrin IX monomethyl ester cyclase
MKIVTINPQLLVNPKDPFTTGIVYMPIGLAYLNGMIQFLGHSLESYDLFGMNPRKCTKKKSKWWFGDNPDILFRAKDFSPDIFLIFANQASNHSSVIEIIQYLATNFKGTPIYIIENTQAVTAYSLSELKDSFTSSGATDILVGDSDLAIKRFLSNGVPAKNRVAIQMSDGDLDSIPFPAWETIPVQNYWSLGFGHGPISSKNYLPILTSRGCPFSCTFCVVPGTNERKWRPRSSKSVVDEMEFFKNKFKVSEFHLEDLNPTISKSRELEIANEMITRKVHVIWKIVAGTKAETLKDLDLLQNLKESGCSYISFSPESGSEKIKNAIGKRFDNSHAFRLTKWCKLLGIKTQACFVIGMPEENFYDRLKSLILNIKLTYSGVSEIAVFIITPIAGSEIHKRQVIQSDDSDISFSPTWRNDYYALNLFRILMYLSHLTTRLIFNPMSYFRTAINYYNNSFELKMEMAPRRAMAWKSWSKNV